MPCSFVLENTSKSCFDESLENGTTYWICQLIL